MVEVIVVTFLDAEVTVDVLIANKDVNLLEKWTGHFAWLLNHCFV